jgi:hypothetical protein
MAALVATYSTAAEFLSAFDSEISKSGLLIRGATLANASAGSACLIYVLVGDEPKVEVAGQIAANIPNVGVAVMFKGVPAALSGLASKLRSSGPSPTKAPARAPASAPRPVGTGPARPPPTQRPPAATVAPQPLTAAPEAPGDELGQPVDESLTGKLKEGVGALAGFAARLLAGPAPEYGPSVPAAKAPGHETEKPAPTGPLTERLKVMTVSEKTQLALSGSREERAALLRDNAKTVHIFVLKNPRIGIDEVQYAAKLPSLSPDALKMISEHRDWSTNATVCSALVRNPKTPLPIAVRMLDRIPKSDLKTLAKGGARDQIVAAARRMVAG